MELTVKIDGTEKQMLELRNHLWEIAAAHEKAAHECTTDDFDEIYSTWRFFAYLAERIQTLSR